MLQHVEILNNTRHMLQHVEILNITRDMLQHVEDLNNWRDRSLTVMVGPWMTGSTSPAQSSLTPATGSEHRSLLAGNL